MLGFVVVSAIILVPLHRRVRSLVSKISVILRTPFAVLRVVPSSWTLTESPSFYRGLVALWVIAGVTIVTAYQSEVFVNGIVSLSSVQPGSTFTDTQSTSTAEATFSLSLVLYQTPISCDPTQFSLQVVASDAASTGSLSGTPNCVEEASLPSLNISFSFPAALSFTSSPLCIWRSPLFLRVLGVSGVLCLLMEFPINSFLETTVALSPR